MLRTFLCPFFLCPLLHISPQPAAKVAKAKAAKDSDDSDVEWDKGSDDSDDSSDDESGLNELKGRAKWLKSNTPQTGKKREKKERDPKKPVEEKKEKVFQGATAKPATVPPPPPPLHVRVLWMWNVVLTCLMRAVFALLGPPGCSSTLLLPGIFW
jgi:hypothetical protein